MDRETILIEMIDTIRHYNDFESTALALFGGSIYEDDSTCFHDFALAQEAFDNLFIDILCGPNRVRKFEEEGNPVIDYIFDRFYDDDVRSKNISNAALLNEFLSALEEAEDSEEDSDESI